MWDLIVSVPECCLFFFYFSNCTINIQSYLLHKEFVTDIINNL